MARRQVDMRTFDLFAPRLPKQNGEGGSCETPWQPPEFHVLNAGAIELRPYARHAFDAWDAGGNFGLVSDTATGKTYLAYALADSVLATGKRVLFCAPTSVLCEQHAALARTIFRLSAEDVQLVTARRTPKRRAGAWTIGRLCIATPHLMANDLRNGAFTMDGVGLVVIDEGHHAARRHAAIAVAEAAHRAGVRILALTASPGGNFERIERIRTNLHLDRWVRIPEEDTQAFRPPTSEERVTVPIAPEVQPTVTELETLLERLTDMLAHAGFLAKASRSPSPADLTDAMDRIRAKRAFQELPYAAAAQQIAAVLMLLVSDDYGIALESMHRALAKQTPNGSPTKTARRLHATPEVQRALQTLEALQASGAVHPKQEALLRVVRQAMADTRDSSRILVFDRYADGVLRIAELLRGSLGVRVEPAIGQTRMRTAALIHTLHAFGQGEFPILVGDDVIREGIHVPAIDHLIVYSPPRNEGELIQLYGRVGRTHPGTIVALVANHDADKRYVFSATARARRMRTVLATASVTAPARGTTAVAHRSLFTRHPKKLPDAFVNALHDHFVFERFLVVEANVETAQDGDRRPYVRMLVGDRTGTVPLLHWCPHGQPQADGIVRDYPPGSVIIVSGTYDVNGSRLVIVNPSKRQGITMCPEGDYNPADYDRAPPC